MLSYDDLNVFLKVVECGNYSVASKLLGVSQPSVSRSIKRLEEQFDKSLIHRHGNNIEVTEFGLTIYNECSIKQKDLEATIRDIANKDRILYECLRVTLPAGVAYKLIMPYLTNFLIENPQIKLKLTFNKSDSNLFTTGDDIAVSLILPTQQTLVVKNLFSANIILCCTKEYLNKYGAINDPLELSKRLIGAYFEWENESNQIIFIHKHTKKRVIVPNNSRVLVDNSFLAQSLLFSNEMIIAGEDYIFADEIKSGKLIQLLPEYFFQRSKYYIVLNTKLKDHKTKVFCDFLQKCVNRYTIGI